MSSILVIKEIPNVGGGKDSDGFVVDEVVNIVGVQDGGEAAGGATGDHHFGGRGEAVVACILEGFIEVIAPPVIQQRIVRCFDGFVEGTAEGGAVEIGEVETVAVFEEGVVDGVIALAVARLGEEGAAAEGALGAGEAVRF